MAQFVVCQYCGSNLDFGERCECQKEKGAPPQPVHPKEMNPVHSIPPKRAKVKESVGKRL